MNTPLNRANITAASLIMLPVYPAFSGLQGLAYAFGDASRTQTPSLEIARDLLPIQAWGYAFLAICVLLIFGYAMRSRDVAVFVLFSAAMAYCIWAACFVVALFAVSDASLVAPLWPAFVAAACVASATSIAKQEGSP